MTLPLPLPEDADPESEPFEDLLPLVDPADPLVGFPPNLAFTMLFASFIANSTMSLACLAP